MDRLEREDFADLNKVNDVPILVGMKLSKNPAFDRWHTFIKSGLAMNIIFVVGRFVKIPRVGFQLLIGQLNGLLVSISGHRQAL